MATAGSKGSKEGMYCKIGQDTEWWIIMLQLVSYDGYVILGALCSSGHHTLGRKWLPWGECRGDPSECYLDFRALVMERG